MAPFSKKIHVVSFNIPYPPNYGGIIDVYYKLKHLHNAGYSIILHCYEYNREPADELMDICSEVYYYTRHLKPIYFLSFQPFIVKTRKNKQLTENLAKDDYPILLEGLHCTSFLNERILKGRRIFVRAHNIEHKYYQNLFLSEKSVSKLLFYLFESIKLKFHENILNKATKILALSPSDYKHFKSNYNNKASLIFPFHANDKVEIKTGKGEYILFHGNLAVEENSRAILHLLKHVIVYQPYKMIVAGNTPTEEVEREISKLRNVSLEKNTTDERMNELIQNAHINLLYTFQATGMKLKLLNALFMGRFCLVNDLMVKNTGLEKCCEIANSSEEIIFEINTLMSKVFSDDMIQFRKKYLHHYSNQKSVEKLILAIEN